MIKNKSNNIQKERREHTTFRRYQRSNIIRAHKFRASQTELRGTAPLQKKTDVKSYVSRHNLARDTYTHTYVHKRDVAFSARAGPKKRRAIRALKPRAGIPEPATRNDTQWLCVLYPTALGQAATHREN